MSTHTHEGSCLVCDKHSQMTMSKADNTQIQLKLTKLNSRDWLGGRSFDLHSLQVDVFCITTRANSECKKCCVVLLDFDLRYGRDKWSQPTSCLQHLLIRQNVCGIHRALRRGACLASSGHHHSLFIRACEHYLLPHVFFTLYYSNPKRCFRRLKKHWFKRVWIARFLKHNDRMMQCLFSSEAITHLSLIVCGKEGNSPGSSYCVYLSYYCKAEPFIQSQNLISNSSPINVNTRGQIVHNWSNVLVGIRGISRPSAASISYSCNQLTSCPKETPNRPWKEMKGKMTDQSTQDAFGPPLMRSLTWP